MMLNGGTRFNQIPEIEEIEDDHQLLSEIEDRDDENQESRTEDDFMTFEEQYAKMIKDQLGTLLIDYIDQRAGKKVINDKTHQFTTMKGTMDEFVNVKRKIIEDIANIYIYANISPSLFSVKLLERYTFDSASETILRLIQAIEKTATQERIFVIFFGILNSNSGKKYSDEL